MSKHKTHHKNHPKHSLKLGSRLLSHNSKHNLEDTLRLLNEVRTIANESRNNPAPNAEGSDA
jgi:hypothetical protein